MVLSSQAAQRPRLPGLSFTAVLKISVARHQTPASSLTVTCSGVRLGQLPAVPSKPTIATYTPSDQVDSAGGITTMPLARPLTSKAMARSSSTGLPARAARYTNFVQVNGVGRTYGLLQASNGLPTPDPQWTVGGDIDGPTSWANLVVNPVDSNDDLVSSTTGNIFETTNQGETWFDIGTPSTFGNPGSTSFALAFGAPDPNAPSGVGNLGNFVYVGTATGEIYVSQNAGGSWTNISAGLPTGTAAKAVQEIITDPNRGSHDAYAVTTNGVYYMANSTSSTATWVNITSGLNQLAYSIFGQSYDPATDANTIPYDLAVVLNSIAANWNYSIPNNPSDLADGYHPVLYVAANSGVYMSTTNGVAVTTTTMGRPQPPRPGLSSPTRRSVH